MQIPRPALYLSCVLCASVPASAAAPPTPSPTRPAAPVAAAGKAAAPAATPAKPTGFVKPTPGAGKPTPTPKRLKGVRGVLKELEPGKSITIVAEKTGQPLTVPLSPKATLPPGLKPGDPIRILADVSGKGPVVEKVVRVSND